MKKILSALLSIIITVGAFAQNTVPISQLPTASLPLTGNELIPVVQNSVTKKTILSNIKSVTAIDTAALYTFINEHVKLIDTVGRWQDQGRYMVYFTETNDSTLTFHFSDSTTQDYVHRFPLTENNVALFNTFINNYFALKPKDTSVLDGPTYLGQPTLTWTVDSTVSNRDTLHQKLPKNDVGLTKQINVDADGNYIMEDKGSGGGGISYEQLDSTATSVRDDIPDISGKADKVTTITINGETHDLSTSQTFTVAGGGGGTTDKLSVTTTAGQTVIPFAGIPADPNDSDIHVAGVYWTPDHYTIDPGVGITTDIPLDADVTVSYARKK